MNNLSLHLSGIDNGKFIIEKSREPGSPPVVHRLSETIYRPALWLIRSRLSGESFVDLLPLAEGSRTALFKTVERLRAVLEDKAKNLVVWDYSTHYHITTPRITRSSRFVECRKLIHPSSLVDDIVRLIDKDSGASAA